MINEISLVGGVLAGAVASGFVGVVVRILEQRKNVSAGPEQARLEWGRGPSALAKNLYVLETIAEDIESTPLDIAVKARLTPRELEEAEADLVASALIDRSSPNLVRLTSAGREVLAEHRIEETSAHNASELHGVHKSLDELDAAITKAVAALEAQHAH